nr:unnamed protein product [Callosobruchus analis]
MNMCEENLITLFHSPLL